jgi:serine/threonine protein kinase
MKPSRDTEVFQELERLFGLLVDAPASERMELLDALKVPSELRQRLDCMFEGESRNLPIVDPERETAQPASCQPLVRKASPIGCVLDDFKLVELIGSGGIGVVYRAERLSAGEPHTVAVKLLAPQVLGQEFERRFTHEQENLAKLDHPHITRLIHSGVSVDGQPYLAMEFVLGTPIDLYCDSKAMGVPDRVQLFLQLCDALSYAHRNMVLHLDIKPTNILVTTEQTVKLLDFGTSRLIQPESLLTTLGLATPAYASPEQLRGDFLTTSSDVYSAGTVLYQLLSGRRPFEATTVVGAIERVYRELEPAPLHSESRDLVALQRGLGSGEKLRQMLRGDLETITAKCLQSNPASRYGSIDALADDLRRYLSGQPVLARPQTAFYRWQKFVKRNRTAVLATAASVVLLAGALSYAGWRQQQAVREARRAVEMQMFMSQLLKLGSTNYTGKPTATVPDLLRLGSTLLPQMIKNPADQRAAQISLAESMFWDDDTRDAEAVLARAISGAKANGDIAAEAEASAFAGMTAYKLGKTNEFKRLSSDALHLAESRKVSPEIRVWAKSFYTVGRSQLGYTTPEDTAIQRSAVAEARDNHVPQDELAYALLGLALVSGTSTPLDEQIRLAERADQIFHAEPYAVCETAFADRVLANLQQQNADFEKSLRTYQASYTGFRNCRGEDARDTLIAGAYVGLSLVIASQPDEAIATLQPIVAKIDQIFGPGNLALILPLSALARAYVAKGDYSEAVDVSARLFRIVDGQVNPGSGRLGIVHLTWAQALQGEGNYEEALRHARLADSAYAGEHSSLPGTMLNAKAAHELVLALESKVTHKGDPPAN